MSDCEGGSMMGAIADGLFTLVEFVGVESREKQLDLVVEIMRRPTNC